MPVTSAQGINGTEKYFDSATFLIYNDDDYSPRYGQVKEVFRALIKDDILKPYISNQEFGCSKVGVDDVGFNLNVFDEK